MANAGDHVELPQDDANLGQEASEAVLHQLWTLPDQHELLDFSTPTGSWNWDPQLEGPSQLSGSCQGAETANANWIVEDAHALDCKALQQDAIREERLPDLTADVNGFQDCVNDFLCENPSHQLAENPPIESYATFGSVSIYDSQDPSFNFESVHEPDCLLNFSGFDHFPPELANLIDGSTCDPGYGFPLGLIDGPKTSDQYASAGESSEVAAPPKAPSRKRKFTSLEKEEVNEVRRRGACLRCKIYRMKCDLEVPCSNCRKVQFTAKIFRQSCEHFTLAEVLPFRAGNSRTACVRSSLPKFSWSFDYPQLHKIRISPQFPIPGDWEIPFMVVNCRRFIPSNKDILEESFEASDGNTTTLVFPPYACIDADTKRMQEVMNTYLDACQPLAEAYIDTKAKDEILILGLEEARRFSRTRETIVTNALKIQAAVRTASLYPVVIGDDPLGIPIINDPKYPEFNKKIVPTPMDYQLDNLYIRYMFQQLDHIMKGLKLLIFGRKNKKVAWYETFLTMLVLLNTLESVFEMEILFVRKYAGTDENIFAKASYCKRTMIAEWQHSAKILIYHFRCVLKAMVPFSQAWTPAMQREANLDEDAIAYIQKMSEIIRRRRHEMSELSGVDLDNEKAKPLIWIAQIFIDG